MREIDPDEGHPSEAFYVEALPCESCGKPCGSRVTASWDADLQVGPCCAIPDDQTPEMPVCQSLYRAIMQAGTVDELCRNWREHKLNCAICQGTRKQPVSAPGRSVERAA